MHELGIVKNVVEQVEKVAKENGVKKVLKLNMEIGEVSSIVPELFTDAFEWLKKRTDTMQETELNLVILQGILKMEVEHEVLNNLIIRIIKKFFNDECANDDIYRRVRSGCFVTVQDREPFLIDRRKDFISKNFRP